MSWWSESCLKVNASKGLLIKQVHAVPKKKKRKEKVRDPSEENARAYRFAFFFGK
jgi:hypothetical protein